MHDVGLHCALIYDTFLLHFRFRMVTFHVGDVSLSEGDLPGIVAVDILRFMREDLPGLVNTSREELISVMDERLRILSADLEAGRLMNREVSFKEFDACGGPHFFGKREPIISMCWVADMESAFRASFCPTEAKVGFCNNCKNCR